MKRRRQRYDFIMSWDEFKRQFNAALETELQSGDYARIHAAQRLGSAISALNDATNLRQTLVNNVNAVSELQAGIAAYLLQPKAKQRRRDVVLETLVESCRSRWNSLLWFFDSVVIGLNLQERGILRRVLENLVGKTPVIIEHDEH